MCWCFVDVIDDGGRRHVVLNGNAKAGGDKEEENTHKKRTGKMRH